MKTYLSTIILGLATIAMLSITGCSYYVLRGFRGNFPRPEYDSGWFSNPGTEMWLYHNVGGNPDNYVIDFQMRLVRTLDNGERARWITNRDYGGMWLYDHLYGAYYNYLDSEKMAIKGGYFSSDQPDEIRVRIWILEPAESRYEVSPFPPHGVIP